MKGAETVLETRELSMHFGGVVAVDKVNFALRENELRCLIGPNGAGKSTFFKCLTGQLRATSGDVLIRGVDVTHSQPHQVARLGVGIKTQVPNLFDGMRVNESVELAAARWMKTKRARAVCANLIETLELGEIRSALVGALAHGQRQMVELAMVLAAEPWLVILDEPTAGMTPEEVVRTADLIRRINESATLIVVEHDMHFIRMIARKVTVFVRGQVLLEDTMDVVANDERVREVYLGHKHH